MASLSGGDSFVPDCARRRQATDILLIIESLCVRYDNCEKACGNARRHWRLDPKPARRSPACVPTSCRHCEHPHCMKDCPPDAIHRAPNKCSSPTTASAAATASMPYGVIPWRPSRRNQPAPDVRPRPRGPARRRPTEEQAERQESRQVRHVQGPSRRTRLRPLLPDRRRDPHHQRGISA
jgi:hypothetical protein